MNFNFPIHEPSVVTSLAANIVREAMAGVPSITAEQRDAIAGNVVTIVGDAVRKWTSDGGTIAVTIDTEAQ